MQGADRELVSAKLLLENARFDLVAKLNELESGRQVDFLECMCECVRVQTSFHDAVRQQMDLLAANLPSWTAFIERKRADLAKLSESNAATQSHLRKLSQVHSNGELLRRDASEASLTKEGYLFRRAAHGAGWKRVWTEIREGSLHCSSQHSDRRPGPERTTPHGINLLLCTVRLVDSSDSGHRFCFEVVTPSKGSLRLHSPARRASRVLQSWRPDGAQPWPTEPSTHLDMRARGRARGPSAAPRPRRGGSRAHPSCAQPARSARYCRARETGCRFLRALGSRTSLGTNY